MKNTLNNTFMQVLTLVLGLYVCVLSGAESSQHEEQLIRLKHGLLCYYKNYNVYDSECSPDIVALLSSFHKDFQFQAVAKERLLGVLMRQRCEAVLYLNAQIYTQAQAALPADWNLHIPDTIMANFLLDSIVNDVALGRMLIRIIANSQRGFGLRVPEFFAYALVYLLLGRQNKYAQLVVQRIQKYQARIADKNKDKLVRFNDKLQEAFSFFIESLSSSTYSSEPIRQVMRELVPERVFPWLLPRANYQANLIAELGLFSSI